MRVLHTFVCLIFLVVGGMVNAQTPTPTSTPHPNALDVGMYQFEDLTSPQIELTGTWSIKVSDTTEFLSSSENGATLSFHVDSLADYLIIEREVRSTSVGTWSICIDSLPCEAVTDSGNTMSIYPVAIELPDTNSHVVITKTNAMETAFDFMTIQFGLTNFDSLLPEETPDPNYSYSSVSGTEGEIETRFDMIVTAGDVAVSSALLFLVFSFWAIVIVYFVVHKHVQ